MLFLFQYTKNAIAARARTPTGTPTAAPIVALLVPPEPPFLVLEVGVGLELEDTEAAALGTLRIVCLVTFAVVCATCEDVGVLLAAEDVEKVKEDVEDVEVVITAEEEADVRGFWAENDPSDST